MREAEGEGTVPARSPSEHRRLARSNQKPSEAISSNQKPTSEPRRLATPSSPLVKPDATSRQTAGEDDSSEGSGALPTGQRRGGGGGLGIGLAPAAATPAAPEARSVAPPLP